MNKILLTAFFLFFGFNSMFCATISGFLRDSSDNEALAEGNVYLEGTNLGTVSNANGYFVITNIPKGIHKVTARYVGYKAYTEEITILDKYQNKKLNIKLDQEAIEMEAVTLEAEADAMEEEVMNIRISKLKLNPRKLKTAATFIQPDLFRALQMLPGVVASSDYSSALYVRGGNDDHNLILYDDITVYNPSHMFGVFSTFITDALRDTKLIKSSYPSEYGGRLGGVLDVRSRDGNKEKFEGDLSLSLFGGETVLSGPVGNGGFLLAGRRTYLEPVFKVVEDLTDNDYPSYYFWEGQGQVYQDFGNDDRLIFSSYLSNDDLDFEDIDMNLNWGNNNYSLRWRHIFSPKLFSVFRTSYSNFFADTNMGSSITSNNSVDDYSAKGYFEYFYNNNLTFKSGLEFQHFTCEYLNKLEEETKFKIKESSLVSSGFFEMNKSFGPRFSIKPGFRISYNDDLKEDSKLLLSPRFSTKYMLDENNSLTLSMGRYYQNLFTVTQEDQPLKVINQWFNIDDSVEPGKSDNIALGWVSDYKFGNDDYTLTIEGYYKDFRNLLNWKEEFAAQDEEVNSDEIFTYFMKSNGWAYGLETMLEKKSGKFNGNISYSFGRVFKKINDANEPENKNIFPTIWDSPHNFKSVLTYNFSKAFNIGTNIIYTSGKPFTEVIGFRTFINEDGAESVQEVYGKRNGGRVPDYFRVDISTNYTWFYEKSQLLLNFSILNVTNHENVQAVYYTQDEKTYLMKEDNFPMFPILPSVRLTYSF